MTPEAIMLAAGCVRVMSEGDQVELMKFMGAARGEEHGRPEVIIVSLIELADHLADLLATANGSTYDEALERGRWSVLRERHGGQSE